MNGNLNLSSQAYEILRDHILTFKYFPGMIISDYKISKELRMSRTPIRQALIRLQQDGLITSNLGSNKFVVSQISIVDIIEIYQARMAIETKAAELIIDKDGLSTQQIKELERLHSILKKSIVENDIKNNFFTDDIFHMTIMKYSQNSRLVFFFDKLRMQSLRARYLSIMNVKWFSETIADHDNIIHGLLAKDKILLSNAIAEHLQKAIQNYQNILDNIPDHATINSIFSTIASR